MKGKRGFIGITVGWIIAISILILGFVLIMTFTGKMQGALDFFNNLFRFR